MLRDILRGEDQVNATVDVILAARPDILLLTNFDWDADGAALSAFADRLAAGGLTLPHLYAAPGNSGLPSGIDLNGDGRSDGDADNQGFGRFRGDGALALLSRWPVDAGKVRDLSPLLWRDLPGARLPQVAGRPFPSEAAHQVQRLSSTAHLVIPVRHPRGPLTVLAFRATPPVFDGPEDRNGLRNADEIRLWTHLLDGALGPLPGGPLVLLGNANLDPLRGSGRRAAIGGLLADPRLLDPSPRSPGGEGHDAPFATADWAVPRPGKLRVDYVLPSRDWILHGAGIVWPLGDTPLAKAAAAAGPHRLVWVDLFWPE